MKKTNLMFTLLAATMLLASCGGKSSQGAPTGGGDPAPSSDTGSDPSADPSEDTGDTTPAAPTAWKDTEIESFVSCFGEALPFPTGLTDSYSFTQGKYEDDTDVIYVCDAQSGDLVSSYGAQLEAAGWAEDEERTTEGALYTTYVYEKAFSPSRGDNHWYSVQIDYSSSGFEITVDEYIDPVKYVGNVWNSDLPNDAFDGYPSYQNVLPAYAAREGNDSIRFEEYDYHEYLGYPYFCAYVYNTTVDEVSDWFNAIAEGGFFYSYMEFMGDDDESCTLECSTALDAFTNHEYEMFFDESFCGIMMVDNHLDEEEEPYVKIEYAYWAD